LHAFEYENFNQRHEIDSSIDIVEIIRDILNRAWKLLNFLFEIFKTELTKFDEISGMVSMSS
jgi:hypothetical protein